MATPATARFRGPSRESPRRHRPGYGDLALSDLREVWQARLPTGALVRQAWHLRRYRIRQDTRHRTRATNRSASSDGNWFPDEEGRSQVRRFVEDNEQFGRDLIVASCWFIGDGESRGMWDEYSKESSGVAIRSTVGALERALTQALPKKWWIGLST